METRANFVLIGSFTLAVIAGAFGFVLWFQSLHTTKARSPLRIVFEGPAAGLRNGGSVNFNGLSVGEVMSVARNSEKIDNVMLKVDGIMGRADNLMLGLNTLAGGKEGGELFLAVKSIRELAEDFDKRSGALMTDGRRTLGDISRAVNNLDRNPTRLLFGPANASAPAAAAPPAPTPAAAPALATDKRRP